MLTSELKDKFIETINICKLDTKRVVYAYSKAENYSPLDSVKYSKLNSDDLSYMD